MTLRVSVIVPAYNEQATILQILREIRKQSVDGVEFEVVVVDDGSRDNTVALLEANPSLYDKLVKQPKNGGKGAAVVAGLRVAQGDYILFQDADLEYSPSHYAALLFPVLNFDAQIVMGSRFLAAQYTRVQFYWHKLGNTVITALFNALFNTTFTDIFTCYLLYRRELLSPDELVSMGWEQHAEILCRVVQRSRVIYEVPVSYHGRTYEEGKKIMARHAIPVILTIIRYRLRKPGPLPTR
jgi:glycosyltransferase involved in cell wall biosynthesis